MTPLLFPIDQFLSYYRPLLNGTKKRAFLNVCYWLKMSKANKVEWSNIDGALPKPKRLHLEKGEADSLYHCPIQLCEHEGFQIQRGCRKHVNNKHGWFLYFDEKPVDLKLTTSSSEVPKKSFSSGSDGDIWRTSSKQGAMSMPSFSPSGQIGEEFKNG